ncbi:MULTISPECIES: Arm DNA-binding domain-containing protein [unclassified Campylobacter]|uniref:Arm DNA-binding domain-containing protein n=1 Tax=unclassified Campylobacter TaxID=2593542 RepID=UPI0014728779|nr:MULTISPECIES: Arm DNA-binding domain-containing protein [unclassified Campylobacter]
MANISKANLQDKDIRKLQPPKSKKKIAVGNPKELYLWLNPSGKKTFFIRTKDDKSLTIGEFREGNSVSEARMDAVKLLKELESGKDIYTIKGKNDKYKFKSLFNIYIEQKQKNGAAIPQNYKIKISVSDDFKLLPGSTKKKPKYQALNGLEDDRD